MIDTKGISSLRESTVFNLHVQKEMRFGKFSKYCGYQIEVSIINQNRYGNLLSFKPINEKSKSTEKLKDLSEIEALANPFLALKNWNQKKRMFGVEYFDYLHSCNPIYISKPKRGAYDLQVKNLRGKGLGSYFIEKVSDNRGVLSGLSGTKCLFVNSYNSGYVNGFIVIPFIE